jgi:predicted dehydrogenase
MNRREFLTTTAAGAAAASLPAPLAGLARAQAAPAARKRRYAIVGTGSRGLGMWGRGLQQKWGDSLEFVGLCDINPKRVELARQALGVSCPTFTDFDRMVAEAKPELLTVTTVDAFHSEYIVKALDRGLDVITEKPMVIDETQCRAVLDAEKRNNRKINVAFNYRFAPKHVKIKELLMAGEIGPVRSVDFHWYLDTSHGADYFRRWHRLKEKSGSLWVHKATHHFDLVNWWLAADPVRVQAFGELKRYGKAGPFRSTNCRPCTHKSNCQFHWDITRGRGNALYVQAEDADGYLRDGCVFREDVSSWDTMTATIKYSNDVIMSYSLNCYMPIEGYALAFNGDLGRLEIRL